MKHIKYFENNNEKPQIGDYLICEEKPEWESTPELINFIANNIGILKEYDDETNIDKLIYVVQYDNIPNNISDHFNYNYYNCRGYYRENIKLFSPIKEKIKPFINANKFNL